MTLPAPLIALALAAAAQAAPPEIADLAQVKQSRPAMGSPFEVTAVHPDPATAEAAVVAAYAEIDRIEALISSWRESSETSAINRNAGQQPVAVSEELYQLIRRAIRVGALTAGAFDISFAALGGLWDFKAAEPRLPDPEAVERALADVNFHDIELNGDRLTVFLPRPGMRIGLGGIGKGYAANRAVAVLREMGASGGLVNAGGDLVAFGQDAEGASWRVAIADPINEGRVFAYLDLTEQAVVTSGDYERFVEIDGKRYAHILDPRTGYPVEGARSVTVICPDGELADALATSVFVLGPEAGLAIIDQLRGIEALVIDEGGKLHFSADLQSKFITNEDS